MVSLKVHLQFKESNEPHVSEASDKKLPTPLDASQAKTNKISLWETEQHKSED